MMIKIILSVQIILICVLAGAAQATRKDESPERFLLESTRPSAYITFEKDGTGNLWERGENVEIVWLRFHNNSKWNLITSVNGCRPEQDECIAFYQVQKIPDHRQAIEEFKLPAGYWSHVSSERTIVPGGSFLFSVPKAHLAEDFYITINFHYQWEGVRADINHQAIFFSLRLPAEKEPAKRLSPK